MLNTFTHPSVDNEDLHTYTSVDLFTVGFVGIFAPSLLLTAIALVNVNDQIEPWEGNNDTRTQFLIENMEVLRNGSYYYNYTNPETGIIDAGIIDSWYQHIIEGQYRYDYGYSFANFCWLPIRIAVLISVTHRLFLLYAALHRKAVIDGSEIVSTITPYLLLNEFLHLTSLYLYYTVHTSQDEKYKYTIPVIAATMLITFVLKMFATNIVELEGENARRVLRIALGFMAGCVASNIFGNAKHVSRSMHCDQMVSPMVAVCEFIFICMVLASYAIDIIGTSSMRFMVYCSAEEVAEYNNMPHGR